MGAHISIPMYQRLVRERYRLQGQKCQVCGKIIFPPKGRCSSCGNMDKWQPVLLSGKGKIYSFTIIAGAGAPPEFAEEAVYRQRYPVALIELEEGPRLVAQLVDVGERELAIGQPVAMVLRRIYVEEEVIRYGYKFRPSGGSHL